MINEFSQDVTTFVGSSAPIQTTAVNFVNSLSNRPFNASHVQVTNGGGGTIRIGLSTGALSTSLGMPLTTGQTQTWSRLQSGCGALAITATSSTTTPSWLISVGAWG